MHYFIHLRCIIFPALFIPLIALSGCGQADHKPEEKSITEDNFPKALPISTLKNTSFIPSLNNDAPSADNVIYASAFLFAWDELRQVLGSPFTLSKADKMLLDLNLDTTFKSSLDKGEYETEVRSTGTSLKITASFKKSLPFTTEMDTVSEGRPFAFYGYPVRSFGMPYYDEKIAKQISILYYRNDDHFIIKITPGDPDQEIILAKGLTNDRNMKGMLKELEKLIAIGAAEQKSRAKSENYQLNLEDQIVIPVIRFNLEKNYSNFIGTVLHLPAGRDSITAAMQRTAFVLNEHGAKVEAVASVETEAAPAVIGNEQEKHKLLWFDKPFVVILRKTGISQPYLMMKIENTELMVKR